MQIIKETQRDSYQVQVEADLERIHQVFTSVISQNGLQLHGDSENLFGILQYNSSAFENRNPNSAATTLCLHPLEQEYSANWRESQTEDWKFDTWHQELQSMAEPLLRLLHSTTTSICGNSALTEQCAIYCKSSNPRSEHHCHSIPLHHWTTRQLLCTTTWGNEWSGVASDSLSSCTLNAVNWCCVQWYTWMEHDLLHISLVSDKSYLGGLGDT